MKLAVNEPSKAHSPQHVESYDVTTQARLYSNRVSKNTASRVGRNLWDGRRIREIRESRELSQEALADLADVSKGDISRHERNDPKSNPSVDALVRLAVSLGVPLTTLFEPYGSPIPPYPRPGGLADVVREVGSGVGGGAGVGVDPVLAEVLERAREIVDREDSAPDTLEGDILKAHAILSRAMQRIGRAAATRRAASGDDT